MDKNNVKTKSEDIVAQHTKDREDAEDREINEREEQEREEVYTQPPTIVEDMLRMAKDMQERRDDTAYQVDFNKLREMVDLLAEQLIMIRKFDKPRLYALANNTINLYHAIVNILKLHDKDDNK